MLAAALIALVAAPWPEARAQSCSGAEIAAVIDGTGAELRRINNQAQPTLAGRFRALAQRKGWPESEAEARSYDLLADAEMRRLDEQAGELLARVHSLGDAAPAKGDACARLAEVKAVARQLIDTSTRRSAHLSQRLDAALKTDGAAAAAPAAPPAVPPAAAPPRTAAAPPPAALPAAPRPSTGSWSTETSKEAAPLPPVVMETAPAAAPADPRVLDDAMRRLPPREPAAADLEYSVAEIQAAGRGLFGTVSAGLAGVIEHAFRSYGRPNGYILGNEGGAAFFAGLRYGDGTLVTKLGGERRIYWQGPSIGSDFGIAGSRAMILVYNLRTPDDILTRFGGVDGSAYLVGGVGITFLAKGRVVLAPIRSGVGVRLGANVGYLKFTDQPSLNPF